MACMHVGITTTLAGTPCYVSAMAVEIHVACRRDPAQVAQVFQSCRVAHVELSPARTVRAWSPRARATLLLRERDVAGVVTFRCDRSSDLATEYAELVARAFEGVAVVDGEVVEPRDQHALSPNELVSAWHVLEGRTSRILEERYEHKRRRHETWERLRTTRDTHGADDRDYQSH